MKAVRSDFSVDMCASHVVGVLEACWVYFCPALGDAIKANVVLTLCLFKVQSVGHFIEAVKLQALS